MNLIATPDDRNSCSLASVELHSRCSSKGRCHASLVSRKSKKDSMLSGTIVIVSSGMIAGRVSLEDSRHRAVGVIVTGMMDVVFSRSWSAEKQAVSNRRCLKVLVIQLWRR